MLNNPEFRRNLWIKLTGTQLAVHPALFLILVALCIVLRAPGDTTTDVLQTMQKTLATALSLLLMVGGTMAATASIHDEVTERTWDQQRLSALSPWQMAWGKLLGSTIHIWYGSAFYIAGLVACALLLGEPDRLTMLAGTLLGVVALHAVSMAACLHMLDPNGRGAAASSSRSIRGLGALLLLFWMINAQIITLLAANTAYADISQKLIPWWFWQWPLPTLTVYISAQACALALLALWRTMRTQLLVPTTPWAWVLGSVWLAVLWTGFDVDAQYAPLPPAAKLAFTLVLQSLVLTYVVLSTQKNTLLHWKTIAFHLRRRAWRRGLELLPLWPISLLLAMLGVAILTQVPKESVPTHVDLHFATLALLLACLHTLRNAGIYLIFAWRNTNRSPVGLTVLSYFLISAIFPLFARASNPDMALLSEPMLAIIQNKPNWVLAFSAIAIQLGIIATWLGIRWHQHQPLHTQPAPSNTASHASAHAS